MPIPALFIYANVIGKVQRRHFNRYIHLFPGIGEKFREAGKHHLVDAGRLAAILSIGLGKENNPGMPENQVPGTEARIISFI